MFSDEPVGKFILQNPRRITQKELQQEFLVSCCRYVLLNFEDKDEKWKIGSSPSYQSAWTRGSLVAKFLAFFFENWIVAEFVLCLEFLKI